MSDLVLVNGHAHDVHKLALDDPTDALERAEDPGQFVVVACERAKAWLAEALSFGDLDEVKDVKAFAATMRVATMQKELGKDAELAATEIVRRAERRIAALVKAGQDAGKVHTKSSAGQVRHQVGDAHLLPTVAEAAGVKDIADLADHRVMASVSDERFDEAIAEAKAEKNLSRANVVRKVKKTEKPTAKKNEWNRNRHRINSTRIVTETIITLDALWIGVQHVDFTEVAVEDEWIETVDTAIRNMRKFRDKLKEHCGNHTGGGQRQGGDTHGAQSEIGSGGTTFDDEVGTGGLDAGDR